LEKGVLHRDISFSNIMLYDDGTGSMERKGLLIDFDHARLDAEHSAADPDNWVTGHPHQAQRTVRSVFLLFQCH
jgi:serine/threonine protein kinase